MYSKLKQYYWKPDILNQEFWTSGANINERRTGAGNDGSILLWAGNDAYSDRVSNISDVS